MAVKSRKGPNFHQGDDLRKKKQDGKRDGLKYEKREAPANKKKGTKKKQS